MKLKNLFITLALMAGLQAAVGQNTPKLALSGVTVTPTLAEKIASPPPATDSNAGAQYATHIFRKGDTLATIAHSYGVTVQALLKANPTVVPRQIRLGQRILVPVTSAPAPVAPPVSLAAITHSLDVQLFDRFKGEQFFNVIGDAELKQSASPNAQPPQAPCDLANPATAAQLKQAGVNYLLVTSVEDFSNQTVEKRRTKDFHYQTGIYYGASVHANRYGRNGSGGAGAAVGAGVSTQGGLDPEVWQQQTIRLTVRCQLFDVATGELKKSVTSSFPVQRDYTAVAQGQNQLSTTDLCEAAARHVSDWATILVDDTLVPIKVLDRNDSEITISRGTEAGLRVSQVFEVCVNGEPIKDPDTGKILGTNSVTVGRVAISKLEPKFSRAKVLEDNGIVKGAVLRKVVY